MKIHWKPIASCVLSHDGWPELYGRWHFAYVYENRERIYDDEYVVEMYVSFFLILNTTNFL
jgi:hypothetical protein